MGEGFLGALRFCLAFIAVVIIIMAIVSNCQAVEKTYIIPYGIILVDGEQNQELVEILYKTIHNDFSSTHFHSGEINYTLVGFEDGVLMTLLCNCRIIHIKGGYNEGNRLQKVLEKSRLSSH